MKSTIYDMARHYLRECQISDEPNPNGFSKFDFYTHLLAEFAKETLSSYTKFLLKNGYTDVDVLEEPTAIDQFLK